MSAAGQAAVWKTSDMATDDEITECLTTYGYFNARAEFRNSFLSQPELS
jgi:hypothetical protein